MQYTFRPLVVRLKVDPSLHARHKARPACLQWAAPSKEAEEEGAPVDGEKLSKASASSLAAEDLPHEFEEAEREPSQLVRETPPRQEPARETPPRQEPARQAPAAQPWGLQWFMQPRPTFGVESMYLPLRMLGRGASGQAWLCR